MTVKNKNPQCPTYPTKPEFHRYMTRKGSVYVLESNSLIFWKIFKESDIEGLKQGFTSSFKPQFRMQTPPSAVSVCLEATHKCCLYCDYCFVKNYYEKGLEGGHMSFESAKKFIDDHVRGDSIQIGFFGGEPLMNMELIVKVVDYCRGKYKSASFHVTTNAILLPKTSPALRANQTIGEYLNANNFSSIISIDGPAEVHDKYRKYRDGRGSHADVIRSMEYMRGSEFIKRTTLRGTFTSEIVNSPVSLKERLAYMHGLTYEGLGGYVSLEPVVLSETSCIDAGEDMALINVGDFMGKLKDQYYEATDWWIGEVKAGRKPTWHQIIKFIERLYWRIHAGSECGAGCGYLSLAPDETITACHRQHSSLIGHLRNGIDEELRAKWTDNRIYNRESCMKCPIRYLCGGGCREASVGEYGDIRKPVVADCKIKEIWTECAFHILDSLTEDEVERMVKNPRDNRKPNMPMKSQGGSGKPNSACNCGSDKKDQPQQQMTPEKMLANFMAHVSKDLTLVSFTIPGSGGVKSAFLDKIGKDNNVKVVHVKSEFNPMIMEQYSCFPGNVVLLQGGAIVKKWENDVGENEFKRLLNKLAKAQDKK